MLNRLFIFCTIAFAGGICLATIIQPSWMVLLVLTVVILPLFFFSAGKYRAESRGLLILLFLLAGAMRWQAFDALPDNDISKFIDSQQNVQIRAVVADNPQLVDYDADNVKVRYVLEVQKLALTEKEGADKESKDVSGKMLASVIQDKRIAIADIGDSVELKGKLKKIQGFNDPGQINIALQWKRQGVTARATILSDNFKVRSKSSVRPWQIILYTWREQAKKTMQAAMPAEDAAIMQAMLFGGYEGISKGVVLDFVNTGIVHILSVSGSHIALVAGTILWLIRRTGLPYSVGAPFAIVAIIVYAFIAGWSPPVMRSVLMGAITLFALIIGREKNILSALFFSGLALLIYAPALLFDVSFQLSFSATAGIVLLYKKTADCLKFLPEWLVMPIAGTWAAQLGALPIVAWYFNKVSIVAFLANLLVMPLIDVTLILGMLAVLLPTMFYYVTHVIFVVCSLILGLLLQINSVLADIPWAVWQIPSINWAWAMAYYIFIAWCYDIYGNKLMSPWECVKRWKIPSAFVGVLVMVLIIAYNYYPRACQVHFIDVGQGDAILIITPHNGTVLIDAGNGSMGEGEGFDVGERVVLPYLRHYGVNAIDYLIASHKHSDHVGGMLAIALNMPVRNFMYDDSASDRYYQELLRVLKSKGTATNILRTGQTILLDGVKMQVVMAGNRLLDGDNSESNVTNDDSVVVKVTYNKQSFLFAGDITQKTEAMLLSENLLEHADVLKVAHHGAKTSTTKEFLQAISPQYGVISVGYGNRFGHPAEETLKRLREDNVTVLRTDEHGAILFKTDGENLQVATYR